MCCARENPIRRLCYTLATSSAFEMAIVLAIIISSAGLALDSPRLHASDSDADAQLLRILKFGARRVARWDPTHIALSLSLA